MNLAGVYVHFPWCLAKCPYCDFVSYVGARPIDHAGTRTPFFGEIDARAPAFEGRQIESVFFGGGTPSLWEPRELGRVLDGVRRHFGVQRTGSRSRSSATRRRSTRTRARALPTSG